MSGGRESWPWPLGGGVRTAASICAGEGGRGAPAGGIHNGAVRRERENRRTRCRNQRRHAGDMAAAGGTCGARAREHTGTAGGTPDSVGAGTLPGARGMHGRAVQQLRRAVPAAKRACGRAHRREGSAGACRRSQGGSHGGSSACPCNLLGVRRRTRCLHEHGQLIGHCRGCAGGSKLQCAARSSRSVQVCR